MLYIADNDGSKDIYYIFHLTYSEHNMEGFPKCEKFIGITKLVRENKEVQMIWGVLSGFDPQYTLDEVLKYPKPYADMNCELWRNPVTMQNPLAYIEIVAFDSSCTLIKCTDKKLLENIKQVFFFCEDLEIYNNGTLDDSAAYENWLKNADR